MTEASAAAAAPESVAAVDGGGSAPLVQQPAAPAAAPPAVAPAGPAAIASEAELLRASQEADAAVEQALMAERAFRKQLEEEGAAKMKLIYGRIHAASNGSGGGAAR